MLFIVASNPIFTRLKTHINETNQKQDQTFNINSYIKETFKS